MQTHEWKPIDFITDECTKCGTIARVGDCPSKDGQPCPASPEALQVDIRSGTLQLGPHRSFVAQAIAKRIQELLVREAEQPAALRWTPAEREAIDRLKAEKDMSEPAIIRQALRMYQSHHETMKEAGE